MSAHEKFTGDYTVLTMLYSIKHFQDNGNAESFALALEAIWARFKARLPAGYQTSPAFCVLDGYFGLHGDLGKFIKYSEEELTKQVGEEAHKAAMVKLKADVAIANKLLSLIERSTRK